MKQRMQGVAIGILVMVLILGTATITAAATRTIEITHGVNIVVNGIRQNLPEDLQPFTSEGRTFLPVRGIADALGLELDWDGTTSTVYLTSPTQAPVPTPEPVPPPAPRPQAFLEVAPWFESSNMQATTINMQGIAHPNSIHRRNSYNTRGTWSNHNLGGQFTTLTGVIGRVDGSHENPNSISFIGDGITLATFSVDGSTSPMEISVDVTGVSVLRIEIATAGGLVIGVQGRAAIIAFTNAMII